MSRLPFRSFGRGLTLLAVVCGAQLAAQHAVPPVDAAPALAVSARTVHAALAGSFTGALRYRDYQDSSRFVTLPTELTGMLSADSSSVRLNFTYDDGPGKTVQSSDRFELAANTTVLRWGPADGGRPPSVFNVRTLSGGDTIRLVAETAGSDDNRPATLRETITISARTISILKEVRFTGASPWLFRHEYMLQRR
jgi:hypothetical protein